MLSITAWLLHFGDGALTPERKAARQRYLEVNPESTFCLFNDGKLLGSIDIVPLAHAAILEFQNGKRGWQFPNEMIEQYAPGHALELVIIDMMTTLNAPPRARELYASHLLRGLASTICDLGGAGCGVQEYRRLWWY